MTARPATAYTEIGSFKKRDVHTNDKKGVIYARLEIFAVLPPDNAKIQHIVGMAKDSTPLNVSPANCAIEGTNRSPLTALTINAMIKVVKNATIVAVWVSYRHF